MQRALDIEAVIDRLQLVVFDFDGVFTDNTVYVNERGEEAVRCTRADGIGLRRLETVGVEPLILSTETNPVVAARAGKLKIESISGSTDKLVDLQNIVRQRELDWVQVAFVGNDINDASCLERVGLPIVVADAMEEVAPLAAWTTHRCGGDGAVREVCDRVYQRRLRER